jgi:phage terminase large subunit
VKITKKGAECALSRVYLPDKIGGGYGTMWRSKQRYIAIKGSRRSKKSKTQAQKIIYQIVKYPLSNALVVRRYYNTLRDSCFAELKWAIHNLGLDEYFRCKESPLEIQYIPTGQKIFFRGMDDTLKITSITVEVGALCWLWVEEAFEIEEEDDFNKLEESLLGFCPEGHFKQITLTFNPWSATTWIKSRFFDKDDPDVLALTTNYLCNEWLSDEDRAVFERMRTEQPERYRVSGLGEWGVDGVVYFEEFRQDIHVISPFEIPDHWLIYRTIDYGLDALAGLYIAVAPDRTAYVIGEVYAHDLIISDAAEALISAEPREQRYITYAPPDLWARMKNTGITVQEEFQRNGVSLTQSSNQRISGWMQLHERLKVLDDVDGVSKTARLKIFSTCRNLIRCLSTIKADEKNCNDVATDPHELTHLPDSLRYWCVMHTVVPKERDERTDAERRADEMKKYKESRLSGGDSSGRPRVLRR